MSYVKMSRGWLDDEMFQDAPYSERDAWAWMIGEARWEDGKVSINGRPVPVKRGQFYSSIRFMAEKFQWSKDRVTRFLNRLETWGAIRTDTRTGQYLITICNYSRYQDNKDTPKDTSADGYEDVDKDGDKDKQEEIQETQEKNITTTRARGVSRETAERPDDVTPETWADYTSLRKQHKAPLTATALDGLRREAVKAGWPLEQVMRECCARGWRGFKAEWVEKNQKGTGNAKAGQFGRNDGYKGSGNPRGKHERARNILLGDPSAAVVEE